MHPLDIIKTAVASLATNKLRATLTILGIIIGVAAVISLMALGRGTQKQITERIEALGTNLLFVRPGVARQGAIVIGGLGSATSLTLDDAYALTDPVFAPSVAAVAPEVNTSARIEAGRKNTVSQVIGVTPEYLAVRGLELQSGQGISQAHVVAREEVAVLGSRVAETLFGFRDPVGQAVRLNGRQFTVIGVLKSKGGGFQGLFDDQVLVPITTAYYRLASRRTTQGSISVQAINVQARSREVMDEAQAEVATLLRLRHRITDEDDFTISSQQEAIETLNATVGTFTMFLGSIAGISLLVGGIGIMNIMLVSVTERTREIGIRKAMGAKRRDILLQFVAEATLLSLTGGLVGLGLGLALSRVLNVLSLGQQSFRTAVSADTAVLALAVSAVIGLFFGIYPALRAARLHPIEALRHE